MVTYVEVLSGVDEKFFDSFSNFMTLRFNIIDINTMISFLAMDKLKSKKLKAFRSSILADTIVGSTAEYLEVPLVTNNPKDFKKFKELEIIVP